MGEEVATVMGVGFCCVEVEARDSDTDELDNYFEPTESVGPRSGQSARLQEQSAFNTSRSRNWLDIVS
jgi:hypothetical protein